MDNQLLSLSKVFTERLFRIPDYQRGYAWNTKQLEDFWSDLAQLESDRSHYTGVVTLEKVPPTAHLQWLDDRWIVEAKKFEPFYVVDGQQRMTTCLILIQVILDLTEDGARLNYTTKTDIQRKFLFDSKDDGISRSYIFGYERDNPSYEHLKTQIFMEHSSSNDRQSTIYTHNLDRAKQFFEQRVKLFTHVEREVLYKKTTQQLLFNIFTISDEVEVCVAFETMNNRGKPLSTLELLKNRLIYLSVKLSADEHDKSHLRRSVNDCWKSVYHNLGRNKDAPLDDDEFLRAHYEIYFGQVTKLPDDGESPARVTRLGAESEYDEFLLREHFISENLLSAAGQPGHLTLQSIHDYVKSLQMSVELWYKLHNPTTSGFDADVAIWLDKIQRLGVRNVYTLLLALFRRTRDSRVRVRFLQALERNLFILDILHSGWGRHTRPDLYMLAVHLDKDRSTTPDAGIKTLNEQLRLQLVRMPLERAVRDRFREGYYGWTRLYYFLYEYNLHLQSESKTERPKIFWPEFTENRRDYVTIEHVFPQRPHHAYWRDRFAGMTTKQRTALRHSLGNLVPLSRPKNSSLSNRPFPEKVQGKDGGMVGFRYGSYAENEIAGVPDWDPSQILVRGLRLLTFMEMRWGMHLGDDRQKRDILNLNFVT